MLLLDSGRSMNPTGWVLSCTENVSVPALSVVTSPPVRLMAIPAVSSSMFVIWTGGIVSPGKPDAVTVTV